jgi:predicted secreted protein
VVSVGDFELDLGDTEEIDVTTHDSSGSYRETVNGFKAPADISIPLTYQPEATSHAYLLAAHGGTAETFRVILPDAGAQTFEFDAIVKGFRVSAPVDGKLEATVTIKPTGDFTIT